MPRPWWRMTSWQSSQRLRRRRPHRKRSIQALPLRAALRLCCRSRSLLRCLRPHPLPSLHCPGTPVLRFRPQCQQMRQCLQPSPQCPWTLMPCCLPSLLRPGPLTMCFRSQCQRLRQCRLPSPQCPGPLAPCCLPQCLRQGPRKCKCRLHSLLRSSHLRPQALRWRPAQPRSSAALPSAHHSIRG